jgi:predicted MFS family arabinose efflux permease
MTGDIRVYMALFLVQAIFCATTTSTVYVRIVIQYIERARGLGLAIVASMPALSLAILGPLLNEFVEANGWREGYLALAIFTGALGATALLMMPSERKDAALAIAPGWLSARRDYAGILKNKAFWIMFAAVAFCNLPQVLGLSQLNLMLLENGVPTSEASVMISSFSAGMFIGRFLCGLALDRFPSHIVAAVTMSLPSIGLFLIASDLDAPVLLGLSVFLIGLSYGGEGDIVAYLVARNFGVRIFSSVQGLMTGVISGSIALGAALLSFTLGLTDSFAPFLTVCGAVVLAGGLLFLLLKGSEPHVEQARVKAPATAAPAAD